jgi:hypothetical protein
MDTLTLYRADYKGNKTLPEKFWYSGLWTKQINSGDPNVLSKYGWIKNILSHIKPNSELELSLYKTTNFLSFTTCDKKVKEYLAGKKKLVFNSTESIINADGFIFILKFNKKDLIKINEGVYYLKYRCKFEKFIELRLQFENPEICAKNFIKCKYCNNLNTSFHQILLIDCVVFLKSIEKKENIFIEIINNAMRDKEWLLIPIDPYENGEYTSLIPLADFINYDLYKYEENTK